MADYHFVTELTVTAARERVWSVLEDPAGWPAWWRWLRRVEAVGDYGSGTRYRLAFRTALRYEITFDTERVRRVPESYLEWRVMGDLAGAGVWELAEHEGSTYVRYTWIVVTTKRWMNLVAPIARPAFSWNHDVLMRDFATGIAGALDSRLLAVESRTVRPGTAGFGQAPRPAGA